MRRCLAIDVRERRICRPTSVRELWICPRNSFVKALAIWGPELPWMPKLLWSEQSIHKPHTSIIEPFLHRVFFLFLFCCVRQWRFPLTGVAAQPAPWLQGVGVANLLRPLCVFLFCPNRAARELKSLPATYEICNTACNLPVILPVICSRCPQIHPQLPSSLSCFAHSPQLFHLLNSIPVPLHCWGSRGLTAERPSPQRLHPKWARWLGCDDDLLIETSFTRTLSACQAEDNSKVDTPSVDESVSAEDSAEVHSKWMHLFRFFDGKPTIFKVWNKSGRIQDVIWL